MGLCGSKGGRFGGGYRLVVVRLVLRSLVFRIAGTLCLM